MFVDKKGMKPKFISGVVEGFYGRPWNSEQRSRLFTRLGRWNMTHYMYAPKDDSKHRALWRVPYTSVEEEEIGALIRACQENNVELIYAISPGLDMAYSSDEELSLLKKKVEQVANLGCKAFAILFDDIEVKMGEADRKVFRSFAHAHVFVASALYEHLQKPEVFLFCPTEYCASRAYPTLAESNYLKTVGEGLPLDIGILWTGPQVISKAISVESVLALQKLILRPPVIWDNLHANDYDRQRLFLGPYQGRPLSLRRHIRGVLTNPNCEYEANFIAIRTLSAWCASRDDSDFLNDVQVMELDMADTDVSCDLPGDMEAESSPSEEQSVPNSPSGNDDNYSPGKALQDALSEWLADFQRPCAMPTIADAADILATPMDDGLNELASAALETVASCGEHSSSEDDVCVDMDLDRHSSVADLALPVALTLEQLSLFVDLLYLPFEHGHHATHLLESWCWLLQFYHRYSPFSSDPGSNITPGEAIPGPSPGATHEEWCSRSLSFHSACTTIRTMCLSLMQVPNQMLICELYSSIWSILDIVSRLEAIVTQLERLDSPTQQRLLTTWTGLITKPNQLADGQEPWVFRGGLVGELQRLLPDLSWLQESGGTPDTSLEGKVADPAQRPADSAALGSVDTTGWTLPSTAPQSMLVC